MEENKKCCEGGVCEKCTDKKESVCCGHGNMCHGKCHILKFFILIVAVVVIFCLGVQLGELKSEARNGREFRGGMMNWNYKIVKPTIDNTNTDIPVTQTPTLKQ
ncbi:MAG: hypothetical protein WCT42_00655 [Candidatus Paceibacterota bacterium]|jgi:hypothetical protein